MTLEEFVDEIKEGILKLKKSAGDEEQTFDEWFEELEDLIDEG